MSQLYLNQKTNSSICFPILQQGILGIVQLASCNFTKMNFVTRIDFMSTQSYLLK